MPQEATPLQAEAEAEAESLEAQQPQPPPRPPSLARTFLFALAVAAGLGLGLRLSQLGASFEAVVPVVSVAPAASSYVGIARARFDSVHQGGGSWGGESKMALAALSRSDLRGLASGALGLACRHGGGLLRTRAGSSHADSAAGSSRHGSSSSKSSNSNDSGSASADAEDAAPSSGRACERPEAARADVSSDRLAALESEVLALRQALSALQHHNTQQQQQPKQQQQQQQQQQPQPHGRDEQADERGAAAKAAAAAAAGDGAGATEAMAEGISKLHPRITRLVQSGYLESLHHLRQRLMVDEWEGGGRQRAARRGVADFEAALAAGEHGEAAAGVGGDGGHGAGAAAGGAGSGGGGDGGGGEAGGEGGGSEQPGTGGTRAGGSGGSGRPAMPLTWEQLTRLYEAPDPARELEAVIADPRLRSAARATLQRVLDERHEKVHDAATALAKELADSVARSPGDLLGGLIKILPLPGFLKPK